MNKITFIILLVLIIFASLISTKININLPRESILKESSVILAFGDSLTYGFGASTNASYPKYMEEKTGLRIINAGVNGEVSSRGLARLPKILAEHKADLVILCHGGNNIIQKRSSLELKSNLLSMIELIQEHGAKILLVGVPNFSLFGFDTHEIYEELANETGVLYEGEVLSAVESDNSLKSDYVHPNAKGYEMMADAFIKILGLTKQ